MKRGWRPVLNVEDAVEAQAARDYLAAYDVDCHLRQHTDPSLSGMPVSPGWGELWVRGEDEERSRELLRRWEDEPPRTIVDEKADEPSGSYGVSAPELLRCRGGSFGLGWILFFSLLVNAILMMLWWDAERRASELAISRSASQ